MSPTQSFTVDNDSLIFARESLTKQMVKASLRPYPSLKIANGSLMPVVVLSGYEWENEIVVTEFDSFGIAVVLASDANDGGKVGIFARRMRYPIRTITAFTEVPWVHIQQAMAKGMEIDAKYAAALRLGHDKKINSVGYDGDIDYGLQGLFTSQLPRLTLPTSLTAAANGDAQLAILNNIVSVVVTNSRSIWLPKKLAMPNRQYQLIANTVRASGTDKTVLEAFLDNQAKLNQIDEIVIDDTLIGKGDNGTDACLVLPHDATPNTDVTQDDTTETEEALLYPIYFAIALDFDIPSELQQWDDVWYRERAIMRIGGVVVAEPLTGLIVSNI